MSSSFRQKGNLLAHIKWQDCIQGPENVIRSWFLSISLVCLLSYWLWLQHHVIARGCLELQPQHSLRFQAEQKRSIIDPWKSPSKFYLSSDWVTWLSLDQLVWLKKWICVVGPRYCVSPEDCFVGVCTWGCIRGITNTQMEFSLLFPGGKKVECMLDNRKGRYPLYQKQTLVMEIFPSAFGL